MIERLMMLFDFVLLVPIFRCDGVSRLHRGLGFFAPSGCYRILLPGTVELAIPTHRSRRRISGLFCRCADFFVLSGVMLGARRASKARFVFRKSCRDRRHALTNFWGSFQNGV